VALGLVANTGRPPIFKCDVNQDRGFAFAEFWDINDCTSCMQLDGIIYNGHALKIKRPRDFILPMGVSFYLSLTFSLSCLSVLPPLLSSCAAEAPFVAPFSNYDSFLIFLHVQHMEPPPLGPAAIAGLLAQKTGVGLPPGVPGPSV